MKLAVLLVLRLLSPNVGSKAKKTSSLITDWILSSGIEEGIRIPYCSPPQREKTLPSGLFINRIPLAT